MRVETKGWIMGRSGLRDIIAVEFSPTYEGKKVLIDGIGKGGNVINGGLEIEEKAMTELAIEWLKEKGWDVRWTKWDLSQ